MLLWTSQYFPTLPVNKIRALISIPGFDLEAVGDLTKGDFRLAYLFKAGTRKEEAVISFLANLKTRISSLLPCARGKNLKERGLPLQTCNRGQVETEGATLPTEPAHL